MYECMLLMIWITTHLAPKELREYIKRTIYMLGKKV